MALAAENAQARRQIQLHGRQANDFLRGYLAAEERLRQTFLQGHYRSLQEAQQAHELFLVAHEHLLAQARAVAWPKGTNHLSDEHQSESSQAAGKPGVESTLSSERMVIAS